MAVFDPESGDWLERGRGIRTFNLVTRALGDGAFFNGITELDPGAEIPLHFHNCEESATVLEGVATVETPAGTISLAAPAGTWIPAGMPHRFVNASSSRMRVLWIYGGPEPTRTIVGTGVEVRIGDPGDVYVR
jgi:quercetin dioxygenase-like cupin family protein